MSFTKNQEMDLKEERKEEILITSTQLPIVVSKLAEELRSELIKVEAVTNEVLE
jgi:hypothetical protein